MAQVYHIAIGDDDPIFLKEAEALVSRCLEAEGLRRGEGCNIDCYPDAPSLLAPELPGWCFCRCHNSYLVNLTHVTELVRYRALMENGEVVPVSKRLYKDAIAQYIAFLKN